MELLDTLKKYGHDSLGYPSEATVKRMIKTQPELFGNLEKLLTTPFKSVKEPLYHEKLKDGRFVPVLEQYVKHLQAMIGNRYSKAYSVTEAIEKLEKLGFKVSSRGQVSNIWNRLETKLELKDKTRSSARDSRERVAQARKEGKSCRKPYTDARKKQLASARKIIEEKRLLAKLEKEATLAKQRLAKEAAKTNRTASDVKRSAKERVEAQGQLKESKDNIEEAKRKIAETGKKVIYEPTPKQAEFHAADEDIVLYGGAAGG